MSYGKHHFDSVRQTSKQVAGVVAQPMLTRMAIRNCTERTTP